MVNRQELLFRADICFELVEREHAGDDREPKIYLCPKPKQVSESISEDCLSAAKLLVEQNDVVSSWLCDTTGSLTYFGHYINIVCDRGGEITLEKYIRDLDPVHFDFPSGPSSPPPPPTKDLRRKKALGAYEGNTPEPTTPLSLSLEENIDDGTSQQSCSPQLEPTTVVRRKPRYMVASASSYIPERIKQYLSQRFLPRSVTTRPPSTSSSAEWYLPLPSTLQPLRSNSLSLSQTVKTRVKKVIRGTEHRQT
ncbi:hypothetical protein AOL_s00091g58 [Orbilia oligospora ATCC 24927]|uniref:Uncharacterized protein n=1 Tax=Arthrobotrys oligospora (strain ATCC 24927 / CBS 115.81 / DSM 1491) TaxID=756982 RepID=G1XI06_ARTOA|nr:hypothetical protein AOL_s00091g58 [Orbilia oligospora ATCC 24927]EGX47237.1 hypothetical protein AOL_s00091g58 [Orbilia oligospora ATCC 24927]